MNVSEIQNADTKTQAKRAAMNSPNLVEVLLFARASEIAGQSKIGVSVPFGADLRTVRAGLIERFPELSVLVEYSRWAVGTDFVAEDTEVHDGMQVALIPPVSGG